MVSLIDPAQPATGHASTELVRQNFQFAKQDIEAMQAQLVDLAARVATLEQTVINLRRGNA